MNTKSTKTKQPKEKRATKPAKRGPSRNYARADAEPSRCPRCQSTDRDPYGHTQTIQASGLIAGKPYSAVTLRRTRCRSCGQYRIDRSWEFVPPPRPAKAA